jgi:hypothetical protein
MDERNGSKGPNNDANDDDGDGDDVDDKYHLQGVHPVVLLYTFLYYQ